MNSNNFNNYMEYMIYTSQIDKYNNNNNNNNNSNYNYYISQISSNNQTIKTYGTSDNIDTKLYYRNDIKNNRIKINNYNNFEKENLKFFNVEITYKKVNDNSNNVKSFIINDIFNLSIKQFKNKLNNNKNIMISFNPIRIYDFDTILHDNENDYFIEQIKLIPYNKEYIIPSKYLPNNDIEIITNLDNYNYNDINININKFNQILVYYNDENNKLSIQSCSLIIDKNGNIIFKDLNFIKFNNIINFYIDKFIITY